MAVVWYTYLASEGRETMNMIEAVRGFLKAETDADQLYWLGIMDKRIMKVMKPVLCVGCLYLIGHMAVWLICK